MTDLDLERLLKIERQLDKCDFSNWEEYKSLKSKLEEKLFKGDKHDELINGKYGILELNGIIQNLQQENQKLRKRIQELEND